MLDTAARADGPPPDRGRGRTPPSAAPDPTATGSLRLALLVLRRRAAILALFALGVPLLAWIALSQVTPRYTATGALIYAPSEYKTPQMQSALRSDPVTEQVMASQAEVLMSLDIARRVAERNRFLDDPEFNPGLAPTPWWRRLPWVQLPAQPQDGPRLDADRNAALLAVQAALVARPLRFSHVIEVSFTATNPVLAAAAVNHAMDLYVKDQYGRKFRMVRRMTELLERRAGELRAEVRRLEDGIAAYRADQRLTQGMHAGTDAEQLTRLLEDLTRARAELAQAEGKLDAARGRAGAAAQAAIAPSVAPLRVRQDQLATQVQSQATRLGPNHPDLVGLQRQLAETERNIAAEAGRVVAAIEAEQRVAAERVALLERDLDTARKETARTAQAQVPLNAMLRDVEVARAQLLSVMEQLQRTAQQAAVETSDAHEISAALPPARPSSPQTARMMAGAVALGLLLGLAAVYALHLCDDTISSGEDLRAATGHPCFALLPEIRRRALGRIRMEDYNARRPQTAFAEQVRALRAGLWLGATRPRVITITSARPGEGKTLASIALARSAALSGERVLLVECDLRSPRIGRLLGAGGPAGLAELLRGEAELEDVLEQDHLSALHIIHAGRPGEDVFNLFMSTAMARLLAQVQTQYDLVLLDSPPVQAIADARLIAAAVDGTLVCVRWRSTPMAVLRRTIDLLDEAGANILGTVLTRVEPRTHVRSGFADAEVYHRRYRQYYRG